MFYLWSRENKPYRHYRIAKCYWNQSYETIMKYGWVLSSIEKGQGGSKNNGLMILWKLLPVQEFHSRAAGVTAIRRKQRWSVSKIGKSQPVELEKALVTVPPFEIPNGLRFMLSRANEKVEKFDSFRPIEDPVIGSARMFSVNKMTNWWQFPRIK